MPGKGGHLRNNILAFAGICAGVIVATFFIARAGWLQRVDFLLFDTAVLIQQRSTNTPIVVIGITEYDLRSFDWPLPDKDLARLLEKIEEGHPAAIGLDIYRDLPEPRSGAGLPQLNQVLLSHSNIFVIRKVAGDRSAGIRPPPILEPLPERVGFNDLLNDVAAGVDNRIRRALLYMGDFDSFALRLATHYLATLHNIFPAQGLKNPEHVRIGQCEFFRLTTEASPYKTFDAEGYQTMMDFRGPFAFPSYTLGQFAAGKVPSGVISNKIVLLGAQAESLKDYHDSPLGVKYGVEIHAHAADQIIRHALHGDAALHFAPQSLKTAWLFLWVILGGFSGFIANWRMWMLTLILGLLFGFCWAFKSLQFGYWMPFAEPASGFALAAFVMKGYCYQQSYRERQLLKTLFAQSVSPQVAEVIWDERSEVLEGEGLRPQLLTATILFSDLKGFSTIAEEHQDQPQFVMKWLNDYMKAMSEEILDRGGLINEYIGDAILGIFGAPLPRATRAEQADDAIRAVRAALGMATLLETLNPQWTSSGLPETFMRIGIYTGPLVTGSIGTRERLKYAAIGDTVNIAARLEGFEKSYNHPGNPRAHSRVLVGEATWDLVKEAFSGAKVDLPPLKGRKQQIDIYQIFDQART